LSASAADSPDTARLHQNPIGDIRLQPMERRRRVHALANQSFVGDAKHLRRKFIRSSRHRRDE
jgi:hypothetical protein